MMKKVTLLMFFLLTACLVNAQVIPDSALRIKPTEKIKFSVQTGTSFFTSPGLFSGTSLYVAPSFSYQVTPKFRLNAGVMLVQQRFNFSSSKLFPGNNETSVVIRNTPSVEGMVYASGDYFLNDRLTLTGSVMKSIGSTDKNKDAAWKNNFQMMSLDLNYKLTPNLSVGAGVKMVQSNGFPGYYNQSAYSPYYGY